MNWVKKSSDHHKFETGVNGFGISIFNHHEKDFPYHIVINGNIFEKRLKAKSLSEAKERGLRVFKSRIKKISKIVLT